MKYITLLFLIISITINGLLGMPPDKVETKHAAAIHHTPEDDSDMLMEPDETHAETRSYFEETEADTGFHPIFPSYTSIRRTEHDTTEASDTAVTAEQNFFPFFRDSQPLGHSRPYYPTPEPPSAVRYNSYARGHDSLLGSGDFGVLRGGTFYQDSDPPIKNDPNDFYSFYNNGHGRPQAAPLIRKLTYPEEQFANFKDFADINTPNDPAYSQFVVVYANKNATAPVSHPNPKNIFEQLQLLDQEKAAVKPSKTSKFKSKLAKTKLEKKYKKRVGPKDNDYEPLLALS